MTNALRELVKKHFNLVDAPAVVEEEVKVEEQLSEDVAVEETVSEEVVEETLSEETTEETFGEIDSLYVADGHHRTAAAYNVGKMRRDNPKVSLLYF